jgi:predicted transcriptional regulator
MHRNFFNVVSNERCGLPKAWLMSFRCYEIVMRPPKLIRERYNIKAQKINDEVCSQTKNRCEISFHEKRNLFDELFFSSVVKMKSKFSSIDISAVVNDLQKVIGMRVINVYDMDSKTYLVKLHK